jgi:hypothetical protein
MRTRWPTWHSCRRKDAVGKPKAKKTIERDYLAILRTAEGMTFALMRPRGRQRSVPLKDVYHYIACEHHFVNARAARYYVRKTAERLCVLDQVPSNGFPGNWAALRVAVERRLAAAAAESDKIEVETKLSVKPTPFLTSRFDEAFVMASGLHRNQFRKGTGIPYVSHLMAVAALVIENGGDEDQAIAALLHDAVEDQGGGETLARIRQQFGERVARIVSDCTDAWKKPKPDWSERKINYLNKLSGKHRDSLLVSLADKVHNARAIRNDYGEIGDELWKRFAGDKNGTIWYYRELARIFSEVMPCRLTDELAEIVSQFEGA